MTRQGEGLEEDSTPGIQGSGGSRNLVWGHMASASYNGGLGRSPQRGPGAEPLVGGSGGQSPLKLKAFELSSIQWKWQKCLVFSIPLRFSDIFFANGWEFLVQILHAHYTFLSMLEYKFLFNYLQLWRSYAILSVTTQRIITEGWRRQMVRNYAT